MKRRIIKQAGQAYTLTLPIEWVRKHGLDKRDKEVEIELGERALVIKTSEHVPGNKVEIEASGLHKRVLFQHIASAYVMGADEIVIITEENVPLPQEHMSNLLGFAIIGQERGKITLKDLNFGNYPHIDEIFRRVYQMVLLFFESAIADIFGKEEEKVESLKYRDIEINKFCLYLERAINKSSYPDMVKGRALFTYSFDLERISDEVERFWRTNILNEIKKSGEMKKLADLSFKGLEKAFDVRFNLDKKALGDIYAIREKVRELFLNISKKDSSSIKLTRHLVNIVEAAADLNMLSVMLRD